MPAKSKAQLRFLQGVAHGSIKAKGLSEDEAKEYVSHNQGERSYSNLPEKVKKKQRARHKAIEDLMK